VKVAITINGEFCKSCGLCVDVCKRDVLEVSTGTNSKGYRPVEAKHPEKCVACGMCAVMCPEGAITLKK
jgi:2-oxoglutarate ferredoxin oxidoreductase subunit delta